MSAIVIWGLPMPRFSNVIAASIFLWAPVPALASDSAIDPSRSSDPVSQTYALGIDDRLSLTVYGEEGLSGEQQVGPDGSIAVPLIGKVQAEGRTVDAVSADIRDRLAAGYLRNPSVSIAILTFRPFYILGEVNRPGEYPYRKGLSVAEAVATAQGFSYRARKKYVFVRRAGAREEVKLELRPDVMVMPGDTLRIGERYF